MAPRRANGRDLGTTEEFAAMHLKFTVWMALGLAILVTLVLRLLGMGFDLTRITGAMLRAGGTGQAELGGWLLTILFWWGAVYVIGRFLRMRSNP
jgi:hypothetical protein